MKAKTIILGIIAASLVTTAFVASADKGLCKAEQREGYYIFILSKPIAEYEFLGTVKKNIALTGQPNEMINGILKKVKKEYPKADGIIFTSADFEKAEAIKFKD